MESSASRTAPPPRRAGLVRATAALLLFGAPLLLPARPLDASMVLRTSLDDMLEACPLVFEGRVVEAWSEVSPAGIHTWVRFDVEKRIKGAAPAALALRFRGGRVGDVAEEVTGSPIPEVGERGIYFVESADRFLVNPLYGWHQGRVRIVRTGDGRDRVLTSRGEPIVGVETPEVARAKQRSGLDRSTGVAIGIRADGRVPATQALRAEEFEAALAARLERVR
ncbi:hypothetical protein KJ059_15960 [Myxococcota bacterium]|nr:hypothetical protein [Myxococcota bacterium]MCZ7618101.1 hypothetical protein [Myxococcota bacterium]